MREFKAILLASVVMAGVPGWAMAAGASAAAAAAHHNDFKTDYPTCGSSTRAYGDSTSHDAACAIRQTIYHVRDLRDRYVDKIYEYQDKQTLFDSSIIGLGIGSVAAAFSKSPLGWVGGLGIAAA